MKKYLSCLVLSSLLVLNACNCFKKTHHSSENKSNVATLTITDKKWRLIELSGNKVPDKVNGKEPFLLFERMSGRYAASGGCNGLGGTYTLEGNNGIKCAQGMSTMMACEDMPVEAGLNHVLINADHFSIDGNILTLSKGGVAPLARFQAPEAGVDTHALNGTWEVNYVSGSRIAFDGLFPGKKPVITFKLPATGATGNSSCNNYKVNFSIDGSTIRFDDPVSTKMACEGNGETVFFKTLKTVSRYSVQGTTLNFIMGDIAVMRLERK